MQTDASGVGLGAGLLQTREGMSCSTDEVTDNSILRLITSGSKNLSAPERRYSNIEREALGMLHGLETLHNHCFARVVGIITNHKPLVVIFKMDVVTLSQRLQNHSEFTNT